MIRHLIQLQHHTARASGTRYRVKRPKRLHPALAVELSYNEQLQRRVNKLAAVTEQVIGPRLKGLVERAATQRHDDDYTIQLNNLIDLLRTTYYGIEDPKDLAALASKIMRETSSFQKAQLVRSLHAAIGVNPFFQDNGLLAKAQGFVSQNVDLITSIDEEHFRRLKQNLMTRIRKGDRVEEIRKDLEDVYDLPKARAALIARDQVGKLYGELNRSRQQEIGIRQYTWRTVGDERVRGTPGGVWPRGKHYELDGRVFTWGDAPITNEQGERNEPGGDYQCRCTGEPILPKL